MNMSETEKNFFNYHNVINLREAQFFCVNVCLSVYQFVIHFREKQIRIPVNYNSNGDGNNTWHYNVCFSWY